MPSPIPKPISRIAAVLAVIVTALGVYWSLRSDSTIPFPDLFPAWLPAWAERHGRFRNFPAYFIVSALWFIAGRSWRQRLFAGFALGALAGSVEIVQIWLPGRYSSAVDAAWSWAGIATAWALCRLARRAVAASLRDSKPKNQEPREGLSDAAPTVGASSPSRFPPSPSLAAFPSPIPIPISRISAVLAVVVTALGVYWSLKPESTMPLAEYFPAWLPAWAERHGEFRNYPAYFIVSVLWFIAGRTWRQRLVAGFALAVFGGLAEVIQIGLPYRYASVADAALSWAGIATAWALCRLGRRAIRRWRENRIAGTFVDQRETKAQRESV